LDLSEENLFPVGMVLKTLFEDPSYEIDQTQFEDTENSAE
jgi:hypothetical protein